MSVMPALRRMRQEDLEFMGTLGYTVRLLSQNTKTTTKTTKIPPKAKPQISYKKQF
jgi:hypothetical protein